MNKDAYKANLDKLYLDKSQYCIIAGGVMLLWGLKETTEDIDIKVKPKYFEELKKKFIFKKSTKYPNLYELDDMTEVKVEDFDASNVTIVDSYPTESLELTLKWMLDHNRPKDQEKIKILQKFLKERQRY